MKRFEIKTFALMTLPALALLGLVGIAALRDQKRDFGPPYRIVRHEVVLESAMTAKEKAVARIRLPKGRAVAYRYAVEPRRLGFWDKLLFGGTDTSVALNGSSCREIGTGLGIAPHSSSGHSEGQGSNWHLEIYDFADIDEHPVVFSFPLSWEENGKQQSITITRRVVASQLK